MRRAAAVAAALAAVGLARGARADGFDAQLYQPVTSSSGFFSVTGARPLALRQLDVGVALDWARDVLVARDPETGDPLMDGDVVSGRLASEITVGFGALRSLELGLAIPVVLMQQGDLAALRPGEELAGAALGDLRLVGKLRLAGGAVGGGRADLAAALDLTVPSGKPGDFSGDGKLGARPAIALGWSGGRAAAAVNLGYRVRGRNQVANVVVDDELTAGAAAMFEAVPAKVWVIGEGFLATGLNGGAHDTPVEMILGGRFAVAGSWMAQAGVGFGLTRGYGAPSLRGVIGLSYALDLAGGGTAAPARVAVPLPVAEDLGESGPPGAETPPPAGVEGGAEPVPETPPVEVAQTDGDGDGVIDARDRCPAEPEDADGNQDEDGCPDLDDDGDGLPDTVDGCPREAEVFNGTDDDDGCADPGDALVELADDRIELRQPVVFEPRRARVRRESQRVVATVAKILLLHVEIQKVRIGVEVGTARGAQKLSQQRAEAVRRALVGQGVEAERLEAVGLGAGDSERIEFVIIEHE